MSTQHSGNVQPYLDLEEHDGVLNAKKVNVVAGTITASSQITVQPLAAWPDPKTYIGLVTITGSLAAAAGNVTLDPGSLTGLIGNNTVVLGAGVGFIGHATVRIASNANTNIGLVTLAGGQTGLIGNNTVVLGSGIGGVGFATIAIGTNVNTNIGLVTVSGGTLGLAGNITLSDAKTYIGLTTTTLGIGTTYIGLATTWSLNAGSTKTLTTLPVLLSTASIVTVITPTNANAIKVTHLLLNSNSTVRLNIKSGVTYLTGNVSLGVNIFPGGGWVQDGTTDSPVYLGNASGPLVVEKFDSGGLIAQVAGMITFYQE